MVVGADTRGNPEPRTPERVSGAAKKRGRRKHPNNGALGRTGTAKKGGAGAVIRRGIAGFKQVNSVEKSEKAKEKGGENPG